MIRILCEVAETPLEMIVGVAAGAAAVVVVSAKGLQFLAGYIRARNGGYNNKPGRAQACIDHMKTLAVLEGEVGHIRDDLKTEVGHVRNDLKKVEGKLDTLLERL